MSFAKNIETWVVIQPKTSWSWCKLCNRCIEKKRVIKRIAEVTGDLIGNKIANRITKVSKSSQQNNLETITNEHDEETPTERSPEERQKIIDDLRLIK